jgi:hypothetical protein
MPVAKRVLLIGYRPSGSGHRSHFSSSISDAWSAIVPLPCLVPVHVGVSLRLVPGSHGMHTHCRLERK